MFLLDSLMISGIQWAIETVITAAETEMNDDSALREQLLEAEMRREMGEIGDDEYVEIEADLLSRIREIKGRREGHGPLGAGGAQPMETSPDSTFQVEASVSGFYEPAEPTPPDRSNHPDRSKRSKASGTTRRSPVAAAGASRTGKGRTRRTPNPPRVVRRIRKTREKP